MLELLQKFKVAKIGILDDLDSLSNRLSLRALGFYTQLLFKYCQSNALRLGNANIFSLYRISLIVAEYKIRYSVHEHISVFNYPESTLLTDQNVYTHIQNGVNLPASIANFILNLCSFDFEGTFYSAFVPPFPGPNPLYTRFSNLRATVDALLAPEFQPAAKVVYYINNPILCHFKIFIRSGYDNLTFPLTSSFRIYFLTQNSKFKIYVCFRLCFSLLFSTVKIKFLLFR